MTAPRLSRAANYVGLSVKPTQTSEQTLPASFNKRTIILQVLPFGLLVISLVRNLETSCYTNLKICIFVKHDMRYSLDWSHNVNPLGLRSRQGAQTYVFSEVKLRIMQIRFSPISTRLLHSRKMLIIWHISTFTSLTAVCRSCWLLSRCAIPKIIICLDSEQAVAQ